MNIATLELYQLIRESMRNVTIDGSDVFGFVDFNEEMITNIKLLSDANLCSKGIDLYKGELKEEKDELKEEKSEVKGKSIDISNEIPSKYYQTYSKAKIELSKQSSQNKSFFICSSWNDLLGYTDYLLNPIEAVYVSDTRELASKGSGCKKFETYINLSEICNLVVNVAHINNGSTYTVLCGQQLDISLKIDSSVLNENIKIDFLKEFLGKDQHKEAMYSLVREALYNLLSDLDVRSRLYFLANNFNAFIAKLLVSYEQYVKNYSFDKVRKEYREKATEYIRRINKVFDDVATKTFSIPLGVWFAISKMETVTSYDSLQHIKNISYCLMVVFLVSVVCWNIFGQFSTLRSTVDEYSDLFKRLRCELEPPLQRELDTLKVKLDERNEANFNKLVATLIFAVALLACTIVVAFWAVSIP